MSSAPKNNSDLKAVDEYKASWRAITRLVKEGASWSGREANTILLNSGNEVANSKAKVRFADISRISGLGFKDDGRALAFVDWDHDGDLDVWLRNRTSPRLRLMLNQSGDATKSAVLFKLEGTTCNRDAIGAKVTVTLEGKHSISITRSLRAGEGFLSQNSKWVHVGLAPAATIQSVTVDWPGGAKENFTGVDTAGRFHLVQGQGKAATLEAARRQINLPASKPKQPTASNSSVWLPGRVSLPKLVYRSLDGKRTTLEKGEKPLLVMFWATWCPSCLVEMRSLAGERERFDEAGLDVLALSVDDLRGDGSKVGKIGDAVGKTTFPYPVGLANEVSFARLVHLQKALFETHLQAGVPIAFLVDRQRRLVAMYRGAVTADVLLRDVANVDVSADRRRDLAVPFAGRWYTKAITDSDFTSLVADSFVENFPDQAARYFQEAGVLASNKDRKQQMKHKAFSVHYNAALALARAKQYAKAEPHYLESLKIAPDAVNALHDLGLLLAHLQRYSEAIPYLERAQRLQPKNEVIRKTLIRVRQAMGQSNSTPGN